MLELAEPFPDNDHAARILAFRRRFRRRLWIHTHLKPWLPPKLYHYLFALPYTPPRPIPDEWFQSLEDDLLR